jgi:hypothetical protein
VKFLNDTLLIIFFAFHLTGFAQQTTDPEQVQLGQDRKEMEDLTLVLRGQMTGIDYLTSHRLNISDLNKDLISSLQDKAILEIVYAFSYLAMLNDYYNKYKVFREHPTAELKKALQDRLEILDIYDPNESGPNHSWLLSPLEVQQRVSAIKTSLVNNLADLPPESSNLMNTLFSELYFASSSVQPLLDDMMVQWSAARLKILQEQKNEFQDYSYAVRPLEYFLVLSAGASLAQWAVFRLSRMGTRLGNETSAFEPFPKKAPPPERSTTMRDIDPATGEEVKPNASELQANKVEKMIPEKSGWLVPQTSSEFRAETEFIQKVSKIKSPVRRLKALLAARKQKMIRALLSPRSLVRNLVLAAASVGLAMRDQSEDEDAKKSYDSLWILRFTQISMFCEFHWNVLDFEKEVQNEVKTLGPTEPINTEKYKWLTNKLAFYVGQSKMFETSIQNLGANLNEQVNELWNADPRAAELYKQLKDNDTNYQTKLFANIIDKKNGRSCERTQSEYVVNEVLENIQNLLFNHQPAQSAPATPQTPAE